MVMIHPIYQRPGSRVRIPEIAASISLPCDEFEVMEAFAGGMGVCLHLKNVSNGQHFGLKSPLPSLLGDPQARDRFLDEVQVWLAASSCSLVSEAFAVIRVNDSPCVCARWMSGGDYSKNMSLIEPGLHLVNAIRIVRGLKWVYEHLGVIHRDLKPQNILLDDNLLAYVADWGLSRPVTEKIKEIQPRAGTGTPNRIDRTAAGSFLGTILYAAPEQIGGSPDIDFRADIYALGCILFELETGAPPFIGNNPAEVAFQHLHSTPPKLGGMFKRTRLGLDGIIARCLQKNPVDRFDSYQSFEMALLAVARKVGVDTRPATLHERYQRNVMGEGDVDAMLGEKGIAGANGHAVVELADALPHLEEAEQLMGIGKYEEAKSILEKFYHPEMLVRLSEWGPWHVIAMNLAYCVCRVELATERAAQILQTLSSLPNKPAEFYINYSLALLKAQKFESAADVCERGLRRFPDDPDIIGNRTIALKNAGALDAAVRSALHRIKIRRDIHSLEEAATVLLQRAKYSRNADLPKSLQDARMALTLLDEALQLKPGQDTLMLNKVEALRFVNQTGLAAQLCNEIFESHSANTSCRHFAFVKLVELVDESKAPKRALEMIEEYKASISTPAAANQLKFVRNRILAERFMIGRDTKEGKRIVIQEPVDYFLHGAVTDKGYEYPIQSAKVLEWLEKTDKAIALLDSILGNQSGERHESNRWEALRAKSEFLSRGEMHEEAKKCADKLVAIAPWRAESYDTASYVYERAGDVDRAAKLTKSGDEIFEREKKLLDNFG